MPATAKRIALGGKNGGPSFLINNPTKWIRYKFDSTRVCMCGCVCVPAWTNYLQIQFLFLDWTYFVYRLLFSPQTKNATIKISTLALARCGNFNVFGIFLQLFRSAVPILSPAYCCHPGPHPATPVKCQFDAAAFSCFMLPPLLCSALFCSRSVLSSVCHKCHTFCIAS